MRIVQVDLDPAPDDKGSLQIDVESIGLLILAVLQFAIDDGVEHIETWPILVVKSQLRFEHSALVHVSDMAEINRGHC